MTDEQKQEKKQAINQRMGQRIATLRKLAGLSQEQLAERAGIGRGHLSRIEAGKYEVTLWIVQAIAEALGMTVDIVDERLADLTPIKTLTSTADVR
jgi:transcriptional regulator with XRE-family HTH domain